SPDAQPELRNGGAADGARLLRSLFFSRFAVRVREPGSSPRAVDQRRPALGDPYVNFVGNVNGTESGLTGYGVYYPVILSIARSHGLPNAYGGEGFSPTTIYAEMAARHPVEVWVEARWSRPRLGTWTAWDVRRIRYSLAEHA